MSSPLQCDLFARPLPAGVIYRTDFLSHDEEAELLTHIHSLPLTHSQYRQFTARRRTVNYGFAYDFQHLEAKPAPPIPVFLEPLRVRVAELAGVPAQDFVQALVCEYQPGTQLGWHRDVPDFELIVGVSLAGACRIRFRPYPCAIRLPSAPRARELHVHHGVDQQCNASSKHVTSSVDAS